MTNISGSGIWERGETLPDVINSLLFSAIRKWHSSYWLDQSRGLTDPSWEQEYLQKKTPKEHNHQSILFIATLNYINKL